MKMNKKGIATIYIVIFIILLLAFVGYAMWDNFHRNQAGLSSLIKSNSKVKTTATPSPKAITTVATTYPNKNLTPGSYLTMDPTFLCVPGTPDKLNRLTVDMKKEVFRIYGLAYPPKKLYQVDHFIPLQLGGSNDYDNLWPQPASPVPGYKEKDKVENYLYNQVCNNTINLTTAQDMIKSDWVKVYKQCCQN